MGEWIDEQTDGQTSKMSDTGRDYNHGDPPQLR